MKSPLMFFGVAFSLFLFYLILAQIFKAFSRSIEMSLLQRRLLCDVVPVKQFMAATLLLDSINL
jgi:hypothetical protein